MYPAFVSLANLRVELRFILTRGSVTLQPGCLSDFGAGLITAMDGGCSYLSSLPVLDFHRAFSAGPQWGPFPGPNSPGYNLVSASRLSKTATLSL
jgi:hypothetical protein